MTKRLYFLSLFFLFVCVNTYAQQPWVYDNAHWKYYFQETNLGPTTGLYETFKIGNVDKFGVLCDELVTIKQYYEYTDHWQSITDTIIVDTNYTFKSNSGDTIFWLENGVFQILYDFSKDVNETWVLSVSNEISPYDCNDSSTAIITTKNLTNIGGVSYRNIDLYTSFTGEQYQLRGTFNERFGLFDGEAYIFPRKEVNCWDSEFSTLYGFLCYEDDSLSYDVNCDFLLELNELDNSIKISPNPFQSSLSIKGIDDCEKVTITDLRGTTIREFFTINELNSTSFEYLDKGIYFILIQQKNKQVITIKILKN